MDQDYRTDPRLLVDFLRGRLRGGPILDVPSLEADHLLNNVAGLIESLAVQPIPLSDRMPGPEDLKNGQAWYGQQQPFGDQDTWDWCYTKPLQGEGSSFTHWLPASTKYLPARVDG